MARQRRLIRNRRKETGTLSFEVLERRELMAITAMFFPGAGELMVLGDEFNNTIEISRNAEGGIFVNGGAVAIVGGTPTVANTFSISTLGQAGNDTMRLDETHGNLPSAHLVGGGGDDILIGGSGTDQLFGQEGFDILEGRGGVDLLFGGENDDLLTGGNGDDQAFGESGNDRLIWNPGDDTDLMDGGLGLDTILVIGGNDDEQFSATANGSRVRFDRVDPAPFSLDIGTSENLLVNMQGGNDTFSTAGNLAVLISLTVDGGMGNDTIQGSNGDDLLRGGAGNDFVDGNQGSDRVFLGADDDTFQWDPGDGSDQIGAGSGQDQLNFNGSNTSEIFNLSAAGNARDRALAGDDFELTRNIGNIVLNARGLESVNLKTLGGNDTVTVNSLVESSVRQINVDLSGFSGSGTGDAAADTVIVNGTPTADNIEIFGSGNSAVVEGLAASVNTSGSDGTLDVLVINGLDGEDGIDAATMVAGVIRLTEDGGTGNDVLIGSVGDDVLMGGDGNDLIDGQQGNDVAFLGLGDDVFEWGPADGNDLIEGQGDSDLLLFFGSNASEDIQVSANGPRASVFRNIANVTMDMAGVERAEFRTLDGQDNVIIGDLTGTEVQSIDIDLRGSNGGSDNSIDSITVNASQLDDIFGAAGDAGGVTVFGLHAQINVLHADSQLDRLSLNGLAGNDVVDASSLEIDALALAINGGLGADLMIGGEGSDIFNGGDGDDSALMGSGDDQFVWSPGDDNDILEGHAGHDQLLFNGANVSEIIGISANGERVRFTRNIAAIVMDLNEVEELTFNALGGADLITVDDLSGTDLAGINLNLVGTGGTGDLQADSVVINGSSGNDSILVSGDSGNASVFGLAAIVNLTGSEAASDQLTLLGLAGDDVIDASGLAATSLTLVLEGGDDDDILIGSDGADILMGGDGDDVLIGGPGLDVLDGGEGEDVEIQ